MNVNLPTSMPEAEAAALKKKEKEIAQGLQSSGVTSGVLLASTQISASLM
jgi:muconolactone delta-isomerase